jgi:hypothetical protein
MKPEELEALANRIDYEELWRRPGMDRDQMTLEQRDRLDAGVNLRRYAHKRGTMLEALKEGREYIRGFKLSRADDFSSDRRGCGTNEWHGAINRFSEEQRKAGKPWARMMYTAKMVSDEVPRMILLFEKERRGLPDSFKMCAHDPSPPTKLPDNHLRCALGQECRKCEYLGAIETEARMTNEAKDEAKAWTCATHILLATPEDNHYFEQFLYDKSDDAFNDRLLCSFAAEHDVL